MEQFHQNLIKNKSSLPLKSRGNFYNFIVHYSILKYIFLSAKWLTLQTVPKKILNIFNRATTNFFKSQVEPYILLLVPICIPKWAFWCLHLSLCFNINHVEQKQLTRTILFLLKQLFQKFLKFFWNASPVSSANTLFP